MVKKEPYPLAEESRTARPFMPWVGGKGKLKEIIYQVFPPDVTRFADHFGGSGAMLLGLPPKADRLDVYNDFDAELTNLFLCVRDRLLALTEELKIFPVQSEAEYAMLRDMLKRRQPIPDFTQDELRAARSILSPEQYQEVREILMGRTRFWNIRRAAAYFKVIRYSYSGTGNSFGVHKVNLSGALELMEAASQRLEGVPITNRDCCHSIKLNDGPHTLHYCDPPYYQAEDKYRVDFAWEDHLRLHEALRRCEGYAVVSYNFDPVITDLYQDFYILRFDRKNSLAKKKGAVYREIIITNFDPRPVVDYNIRQMSMFNRWDSHQEEGALELVHQPEKPLRLWTGP